MRLITAHKILIGTTVVFFTFFAFLEMRGFAASGSLADLAAGVAGLAVAIGFGLYLRTVFARARHDARRPLS